MQFDAAAGLDVRQGWQIIKEQNEPSTLPEVSGSGTRAHQLLGLGQKLGGKHWAI